MFHSRPLLNKKNFNSAHFTSLISKGNFIEAKQYLDDSFKGINKDTPLFNVDTVLSFVGAAQLVNKIEHLTLPDEFSNDKKNICAALDEVIKQVWLDRYEQDRYYIPPLEACEYADFALLRKEKYDAAVTLLCGVYREYSELTYPEPEFENVRNKLCRCIVFKAQAVSQSTTGESKQEAVKSLSIDDKKNISEQALKLISLGMDQDNNETSSDFFQAAVYIVAKQEIDRDYLINQLLRVYRYIAFPSQDIELFVLRILAKHFQRLESSAQSVDLGRADDSCVHVMDKNFNAWQQFIDERINELAKPKRDAGCIVS